MNGNILETAKTHEQKVEELYRVISRELSHVRKLSGTLLSKGSQVLADLQGDAGGAVGG